MMTNVSDEPEKNCFLVKEIYGKRGGLNNVWVKKVSAKNFRLNKTRVESVQLGKT